MVRAESTWFPPVPVGALVTGGVMLEFTETESLPEDFLEFELLQDAKQNTIAIRRIECFMIESLIWNVY